MVLHEQLLYLGVVFIVNTLQNKLVSHHWNRCFVLYHRVLIIKV